MDMSISNDPKCDPERGLLEDHIRQIFATIDRQDAAGFVGFLTPDASFRFANMPTAQGHQAIVDASNDFFSAIKSLKHEFIRFFDFGDVWVIEQTVRYVDRWERDHAFPCTNILRFEDGLIADYRIFMDTSPLFIPPAAP